MTSPQDRRHQMLKVFGERIRLAEMPDKDVMAHACADIILGTIRMGDVSHTEMAELLAIALVDYGGFHRIGSCQW